MNPPAYSDQNDPPTLYSIEPSREIIDRLQVKFDMDLNNINAKYDVIIQNRMTNKENEIQAINSKYQLIVQKITNEKKRDIDEYKRYRTNQLNNVLHTPPKNYNISWIDYLYSFFG